MHAFSLTDDQQLLKARAAAFARKYVQPRDRKSVV